MTEDQVYRRRWARMETTKVRRAIEQAYSWTFLNTNRSQFWTSLAALHAKKGNNILDNSEQKA